jgi:hypothetical protein
MPLVEVRLFPEGRVVDAEIFFAETDFQRAVIEGRITANVEGRPVNLVSAEDLLLFTLIAARPRDPADIQDVLFTQGEFDKTYLRRWAGPLGVEKQLDEIPAAHE